MRRLHFNKICPYTFANIECIRFNVLSKIGFCYFYYLYYFKRRWYHEYNIIWYNFLLFILNLYITMIISPRIVKIAKRFVWKIWNLDEKLKNREKINHCTIRLLRNIFVFKFFHSSKQFTCIICTCIYTYWLINLSVYEI